MDIQMFLSLLEDPEVRVRKAVGELLGEISRVSLLLRSPEVTGTVYVWEEVGPRILESIERNYSREEQSVTSDGCDPTEDPEALEILDPVSSLLQQSYKAVRPGVGEMRHDTEGWRCLETSFAALNAIMVGYGPAFGKYIVAGLRRARGWPPRWGWSGRRVRRTTGDRAGDWARTHRTR
jgi:hypothetical protein